MADSHPELPLAARQMPPYKEQNAHEVLTLVQSLRAHQTKGKGKNGKRGFTCKQTTFAIPQLGGRLISSWKFMDWDYKRDDLPTYARGLFTYTRSDGVAEIAVRGYDKFFNTEEVNDTKWRNIENNTRGPYELSNKENGCIIFIAGLEGDKIVTCSKHSTGERGDASASHAVVGERWLERHLSAVGRTKDQLARELRRRNVTLVAELCDDAFEEHVLEYGPEVAGLYVHGINLNVPQFTTYPFHLVQAFADEWGLKKAKYVVEDRLDNAKDFLEKCAETGSWSGRDTEGFVIRCQKKVNDVWIDWFFKYKFEEPYLMYRQWREATRALISGKQPRYKKHAKITEAYILYARQQFAQDRSLAKKFSANHGIIALRDGFLAQQGVKGSDIIKAEESAGEDSSNRNIECNVVLVPISTIGCGKTTIANALVSLFGWGHVQNDNITGQKGRPRQFVIQITNQMAQHPAVIADRNNHQRRERRQLFDDISKVVPSAKFVALHYVHDPKDTVVPKVREVTKARVLARGDNHQTIRASSKDSGEITAIMNGFLDRFEPLDDGSEPDNNFDEIINIDPCEDSRQNLDVVVEALHKGFPKLVPSIPSPEELDRAVDASLNDYSVQLKHDLSFGGKNKKEKGQKGHREQSTPKVKDQKVEYFAIRVPTDQVVSCLNETFDHADPNQAVFYRKLQQLHRVQPKFHVTLIHTASKQDRPDLWDAYERLQKEALERSREAGTNELAPLLGICPLKLDRVVWDDKIMAIAVKLEDPQWQSANATPHITVGTASPSVKPKESNELLARRDGVYEALVKDYTEIRGEVRAVTPATR